MRTAAATALLRRPLLQLRRPLGKSGAGGLRTDAITSAAATPRPRRVSTSRTRQVVCNAAKSGTDADTKFWVDLITDKAFITNSDALKMLRNIDQESELGVHPSMVKGRGQIHQETLATKRLHKRKLALVQVGDFYETMGIDAVVLVQVLGLKPMGMSQDPDSTWLPRAGFPVEKLAASVEKLVAANLEVAVCDQVADSEDEKGTKMREVTRVATPSCPLLLTGVMSDGDEAAAAGTGGAGALSVAGVYYDSFGFHLVQLSPALRRETHRGFPSERVLCLHLAAKRAAGGVVTVYVHDSVRALEGYRTGSARGSRGAGIYAALHPSRGGLVKEWEGANAREALAAAVCADNGLPAGPPFESCEEAAAGRPQPLLLSTAANLGLLPQLTRRDADVPSLPEALLGRGEPPACMELLRALLLEPPPEAVARASLAALSFYRTSLEPIDEPKLLSPERVKVLLGTLKGSSDFFADLIGISRSALAALERDATREVSEQQHCIAQHIYGGVRPMDVPSFQHHLRAALDAMQRLIPCGSGSDGGVDTWSAGGRGFGSDGTLELGSNIGRARSVAASWDYGDSPREWSARVAAEEPVAKATKAQEQALRFIAPTEFVWDQERRFRCRVMRSSAPDVFQRVDDALDALERALQSDFAPLLRVPNTEYAVAYMKDNAAVWLKVTPKATMRTDANQALYGDLRKRLEEPKDRNDKQSKIKNCVTTPAVEAALGQYRAAVAAAEEEVEEALRELNEGISEDPGMVAALVGAAALALVRRTLVGHAREAQRRRWALPVLLPAEDGREGAARPALAVEGLHPYWMEEASGARVVRNSFECRGMFLLTGPNMGGKSTLCRNVVACALLANCGLCVPATAASVPLFDAFLTRMTSSDAPSDGLSHYKRDMHEARTVLDIATPRSLVMLDELGQGTEASSAAAIAGAVLAELDRRGCRGFFSTHLHELLGERMRLAEHLRNTVEKRMELAPRAGDGRLEPTWRMLDGRCTESLALSVAEDCDMPDEVLRMAREFLRRLPQQQGVSQQSPPQEGSRAAGGPAAREGAEEEEAQKERFERVVEILREVAEKHYADSSAGLQRLRAGQGPPPSITTAVYTFWTKLYGGSVYCGETDDLATRLKTHRSKWAWVQCAYVPVPKAAGGRSSARTVETEMHGRLKQLGIRVESTANNKRTGVGAAPPQQSPEQ